MFAPRHSRVAQSHEDMVKEILNSANTPRFSDAGDRLLTGYMIVTEVNP
jgi:hypothetical protein